MTAPIAILAVLYAGGYLGQFIGNYALWKQRGGYPGDGTSPLPASPGLSACLRAAVHPPYGIYGIFICIGLLAVLLLFVMRIGYSDTGEYDEDRNFTYSAKGTYGTSGWMSRKEMAGVLELVADLRRYQGIVLGMLDRKAVCVPEKTRLNSNLAVYGASGSMKTRSFCMNRILQGVSRGNPWSSATRNRSCTKNPANTCVTKATRSGCSTWSIRKTRIPGTASVKWKGRN